MLTVSADIIEWRGPAPFYFLPIPPAQADEIKARARELSYGWGVIPVTVTIGTTTFTTSLFPKDGSYLLPLKDAVRKPENLLPGDRIEAVLELGRH